MHQALLPAMLVGLFTGAFVTNIALGWLLSKAGYRIAKVRCLGCQKRIREELNSGAAVRDWMVVNDRCGSYLCSRCTDAVLALEQCEICAAPHPHGASAEYPTELVGPDGWGFVIDRDSIPPFRYYCPLHLPDHGGAS